MYCTLVLVVWCVAVYCIYSYVHQCVLLAGDGASTSRLVTRPLLHSNCALLSAPPNAGRSLAETALPSISPLTRSLTTLPWRPSTYYSSTRVAPNTPLTRSGPPPLSRSSELLRIDDFKVCLGLVEAAPCSLLSSPFLSFTHSLCVPITQVPQVFASARNALYTRYTPSDWANTQRQHYLTADKFRQLSESLRTDSNRLAREVDDQTRAAQDESGKKLGERVSDIEFWRCEPLLLSLSVFFFFVCLVTLLYQKPYFYAYIL